MPGQPVTPEWVSAGKDKIERGERQAGDRHVREYRCRTCSLRIVASYVPRGWYTIARHTERDERPTIRIGAFCSIACLSQQIDRFAAIERQLGDEFDASPYQQDREPEHRRQGGQA